MKVLINNVVYIPQHEAPETKGDLREILIEARKHTGETLQKAADGIGISKSHLWELEKGSACNPTYDVLREIVNHYGITPKHILGC